MTTPELIDFIKGELAKGADEESITKVLVATGWDNSDVREAFDFLESLKAPIAAKSINPIPVNTSPIVNTPVETKIEMPVNPVPVNSNLVNTNPSLINTQVVNNDLINSYNTEEHLNRKSKLIPAALITLFLILVGGGAVFAYSKGLFESPSVVLATTQKNLNSTTSLKFDMTMKVKTNYIESEQAKYMIPGFDFSNIVMQFKGASQSVDSEDKVSMTFFIGIGDIEASAQLRLVDKVMYAMLEKVPSLGLMDISAYQNKWFSFKLDDEQDGSLDMVPLVGASGSALSKLTEEEKTEFKNLAINARFVKVLKKNGTEQLGEVSTSRYTFDLDREGISEYINSLDNFIKKLANKDSYFSAIDMTSTKESLDKMKNFQGEIWIGKKDKLPYKLTFSFSTDIGEEPNIKGTYDVNIFILMNDWNVPVAVEKPEIVEDFQAMINPQLEEARSKSKDALVKAHLSNMRALAELYYDINSSGYKGFCKSSGTYSPIQSLSSINEAIKPALAVCKDSSNSWIAYGPLASGFWCVDSSGVSMARTKAPVGMSCK